MNPVPEHRNLIALGRAYVRLIEGAEHIAECTEVDAEAKRMRQLAKKYKKGLGLLLATQPEHVIAKILVASEKILGPVNETGRN